MAEKLDSFKFERRGGGIGSRYDQYLDGSIYRLVVGEDVPSVASRVHLYERAKKRGLKLRTAIEGDSLIVQAYTPNGSQP